MSATLADQRRRIATHNSTLRALVEQVDDDVVDAASAAARASAGAARSPINGRTMAIKANIAVAGRPLTAASAILQGYTAPTDATCVARLKAAGVVIVGASNMDEFGMGSSTERGLYGAVKNPWDHRRTAGGSSGGAAAAVAAGFVDAALGTDTGGSVRQPAAFCGVTGFKPTYGRISRRGVVAYASSLDQVGIIAADVDGVADVADVVCGADVADSTTVDNPLPDLHVARPAPGLRVGVLRSLMKQGVDSAIVAAVDLAAADLNAAGAVVSDVDDAPLLDLIGHAVSAYYVIATAEASSNLSRYDGVRYGPRGAHHSLSDLYSSTRALFGDEVKRRILLGTFVLSHGFYEAYLLQAQKVRARLSAAFTAVFRDVDVLLLPTTPTLPFVLGDQLDDPLAMYLGDAFTLPASLAGLPAISVPTGATTPITGADGDTPALPIAVQLIGRAWDEGTLLSAARVVARPAPLPIL